MGWKQARVQVNYTKETHSAFLRLHVEMAQLNPIDIQKSTAECCLSVEILNGLNLRPLLQGGHLEGPLCIRVREQHARSFLLRVEREFLKTLSLTHNTQHFQLLILQGGNPAKLSQCPPLLSLKIAAMV